MKITPQEEYGLRCLLTVARAYPDEPCSISEIAEHEGLSEAYVGKLMNLLRQGGLVDSIRGRGGGYLLPKPPEDISIFDVIDVLGGSLYASGEFCERFPGEVDICVHKNSCSVRSLWQAIDFVAGQILRRTTLADLTGEGHSCLEKIQEQVTIDLNGTIKATS